MTRQRSLNVHNSDRFYNCRLTTKEIDGDFTKVTRLNEGTIERDMDKLQKKSKRFNKRDNKAYLLYQQRYSNDTVQDKVFNHGGRVSYYTTDRVPVPIINKLSSVPNSEVVFYCKKEHELEDVLNIQHASMATKTTIDVPIVLPDINPYGILLSLHPLRYHVDNVKLSFPSLTKSEIQGRHKKYYVYYNGAYHLKSRYKFQFFKFVQEPLSSWKMNIWLVCDTDRDREEITKLIKKGYKNFKDTSPMVKGDV